MRTCDYSEVLNGSAALAGMGAADIGLGELALFRTFHDRRLQAAWEIHEWPELCPLEQRTFRAQWDPAVTYAGPTSTAAVEVYDVPSGNYYQSLQAANLNNAPTSAGGTVVNAQWWAVAATQYSAAPWATGASYAVGAQVLNPADNQYYQCISAHVAGVSFDGTKFGLLTAFDRYLSWTQTGQTVIGEFLRATDKSPKMTTKVVEIPFELSQNGAQFTQLSRRSGSGTGGWVPPFVWIKFRLRRPTLVGDVWDSTLVYTSGRQVYFVNATTGIANFFTANQTTSAGDSPVTASAKWDVVQIPYLFRGFLIDAGYADWLTGDGQATKAAAREGMAMGYLELEADKLQRQQGQVRRLNWKG